MDNTIISKYDLVSEKPYWINDKHTCESNKARNILLAIVGPSASGKDTLAKELGKRLGIKCVVSDTTRPRRKNEVEGVDYNFISKSEFLDGIENKEYIEWSSFNGWFYGTPKSSLNKDISLGVFNLEGLAYMHRHSNICVIPIYLNDSFPTRLKRSIKREGKFKFEYLRRGVVDAMDFAGFENYLKLYSRSINLSNMDMSIEDMASRVILKLHRWAILDNYQK